MAEYTLSINEIIDFVSEQICISPEHDNLDAYKASILFALTAHEHDLLQSEMQDNLELWENKLQHPSELVIGNRYIRIKDAMMSFVEGVFGSGFLDAFIAQIIDNSPLALTVSMGSAVAVAIMNLLNAVSRLNDVELCVYRQAIMHHKSHEEFTQRELEDWLPHEDSLTCNIPDDNRWDCDCRKEEDVCIMCPKRDLPSILDSLCAAKKVLSVEQRNGEMYYRFMY